MRLFASGTRRRLSTLVATIPLLLSCGENSEGVESATPKLPADSRECVSAFGSAELLEDYVNLTEEKARELAGRSDKDLRVVGQDGECSDISSDLRSDRVTVYLDDGLVAWAVVG